MTKEQLQQIADDPKKFLSRGRVIEHQIRIKNAEIQRYRDLATQITQEIKEITTFSLTPSHKIEECSIAIVELENEIATEIRALQVQRRAIKDAVEMLEDYTQREVLEARYLSGLKWEDIAVLLGISYRWTLRQHGQALENLSKEAMLIHAESAL